MKNTEKIVIDWVGSKTSKSGKPFVSIKSGEKWYSCWEKDLFSTLLNSKGQKFTVITEANGDFVNVMDIVSDEIGIQPKKIEPKMPRDIEAVWDLCKEIDSKVDQLLNR